MSYKSYAVENITRILVSGGGLGNGNTCAYIEFMTDEPNDVWYVEYGKNPTRELVGNDGIEWNDDGDGFKVVGVDEKVTCDCCQEEYYDDNVNECCDNCDCQHLCSDCVTCVDNDNDDLCKLYCKDCYDDLCKSLGKDCYESE